MVYVYQCPHVYVCVSCLNTIRCFAVFCKAQCCVSNCMYVVCNLRSSFVLQEGGRSGGRAVLESVTDEAEGRLSQWTDSCAGDPQCCSIYILDLNELASAHGLPTCSLDFVAVTKFTQVGHISHFLAQCLYVGVPGEGMEFTPASGTISNNLPDATFLVTCSFPP
jgi:hypothetical protein